MSDENSENKNVKQEEVELNEEIKGSFRESGEYIKEHKK